MAKDAGDWEPYPGERVRIDIPDERRNELVADTPDNGFGIFVRHLGDHERFPYEVMIEFCGRHTYALDELSPVNDGRN